jgi:mono/diheme cytochrome c family protein
MMRRVLAAGILAVGLAASVQAGGWAVITVDTVPEAVQAGRPSVIAFTVRAHGVTPVGGLTPWIEARAGERVVTVKAGPDARQGRYAAKMVLPETGDWVLTIHSSYGSSRLTLDPIAAVAALPAATSGPSRATAAEGRRLFLAKGCVTCHQNSLGTPNQSSAIGPTLVAHKYQAEFLARILADPAGTLRPSPDSQVRMPNLELRPAEIASLVAFINGPPATASR